MSPDLEARYLRLLGVPRRKPSLEALTELVEAHLTRVPFENVSKLLMRRRSRARGLPDLAAFLDGVERFGFGGTCYANNYHLHLLLGSLGYEVALCGADMARPDVHVVNVVQLEERAHLVDGGYGAPFLAPMPLDLDSDQEVALGCERYVLEPRQADGRSRLLMYRDGRHRHGYSLSPRPRRIEEFAPVIEESFAGAATFMNALVVARFFPGRSLVLRNLTLVESERHEWRVSELQGPEEAVRVAQSRFGIPEGLVREAIEGLDLSRDPWSAG